MNVVRKMFEPKERPPMQDMPVQRREMSTAAAQAAQHVIDLENENQKLRDESSQWERAALLAEEERDRLHADLARQTAEREHLTVLITELKAEFVVAGEIVMKSLAKIKGDGVQQYAPKPENIRSLEHALLPPVDEQSHPDDALDGLPSVVARGPMVPV